MTLELASGAQSLLCFSVSHSGPLSSLNLRPCCCLLGFPPTLMGLPCSHRVIILSIIKQPVKKHICKSTSLALTTFHFLKWARPSTFSTPLLLSESLILSTAKLRQLSNCLWKRLLLGYLSTWDYFLLWSTKGIIRRKLRTLVSCIWIIGMRYGF